MNHHDKVYHVGGAHSGKNMDYVWNTGAISAGPFADVTDHWRLVQYSLSETNVRSPG